MEVDKRINELKEEWNSGHVKNLGELFEILENKNREIGVLEEGLKGSFKNTEYYRSLVVKIGQQFGDEAYISDDGSKQDSILCAKVPELVTNLLDIHNYYLDMQSKKVNEDLIYQRLEQLLDDIDALNAIEVAIPLDNSMELRIGHQERLRRIIQDKKALSVMDEYGFMDAVDFECELGYALGGNKVYPTVENVKENQICSEECGIVKVKVSLIERIEKGTR